MAVTSVLFVTRSLPFHGLGGMEVVAWDLARAFTREGIQVSVLTTACPAVPSSTEIDGIKIHCIQSTPGRYSAKWWRQTGRFFKDPKRDRYDAVLSVSMAATGLIPRPRVDHTIFAVQCHGTTWSEIRSKLRLRKPIEWLKALYITNRFKREWRYRWFDAVIAIGPNVLSDLHRYPTKALEGKVPVREISNGIDTDLFKYSAEDRQRVRQILNIGADTRLIISVSRLHSQKGVQFGLAGFSETLKADADQHYLVVGSGPHDTELKKKSEELGIKDKVTFWGAAKRDDLPGLYSAADVFLFTTIRVEGLPLNVIEALACGLPVILSSHIELHDQKHQFCVDPTSSADVGAALANRAFGRDLNNGHCLLNERFWLSTSAKAYLALFEELSQSRAVSGNLSL